MIRHRHAWVLTLLFLALAAAPVRPQEEVVLKNGQVMKGRVVEDDGSKISVKLKTDGAGSATASYSYDELDPGTIYRLRLARTPREDAKKQLELANYAYENGEWESARLSFLLAEAADKKQGGALKPELDALLKRAAPTALKLAKDDIAQDRVLMAEKKLGRILEHVPESPEAEEARKLLEELSLRSMEAREKRRVAAMPASARDKTAKEAVAPAKTLYDKAHTAVRDGLKNSDKQSQALQSFRSAISNFEQARKQLEKILKDQGPESDFAAHYPTWDAMVVNDIVETRLHMASAYFVRGSFNNALEEVNGALSISPDNSEALAMRSRIEVASAESGRWRW